MSFFFAPSSIGHDSRQIGQFRAFFALDVIRQTALLLAFLGALGILSQFFVLGILRQTAFSTAVISFCGRFLSQAFFPIWLVLSISGLTICLAAAAIASRLATKVGQALLEKMRDNPCEHSFLTLLHQVSSESAVLLHPAFRLGNETYLFDLAVVSSHGLTFVRGRPGLADNHDLAPLQTECTRLSEENSLPLLKKVRFIQLWEPKAGPEWQTSQIRDLGRFFQRSEVSATRQEIAHSLRALYNLALPATQAAVPVQGGIPTAARRHTTGDYGLPQKKRRSFRAFGKLILHACLVLLFGGLAVFLLQFFDYPTAEKVFVPTRAILRNTLPANWQEHLRLGEEIFVNEEHIYAQIAAPSSRLALTMGEAGQGRPIKIGTELRILQAREDESGQWFLVSLPGVTGWLPASAMKVRHLLPKGSPIYARPDINAEPRSFTNRAQPVALVSVWKRPAVTGEVVWSKVLFLDRQTAYFRGSI